MKTSLNTQMKRSYQAVLLALTVLAAAPLARAGAGVADNIDKAGNPYKQATFYANSPSGLQTDHTPGALTRRDTGRALRKFVDSLPLVDGYVNNQNLVNANASAIGRHIPLAVKEQVVAPATGFSASYPDADFYEIAVVEYREQLHSDLPPVVKVAAPGAVAPSLSAGSGATAVGPTVTGGTTLRGYVQIWTPNLPAAVTRTQLFQLDGTPVLDNKGSAVFMVGDQPHYLGPIIDSQSGVPVRIRFDNYLPVGHYDPITKTRGGDIFLPTDTTIAGAGVGPNGAADPMAPRAFDLYSQNRANIHLQSGDAPWISAGNPNAWITPAGDNVQYPVGATTQNVPDMPNPGAGAQTYYLPNRVSSRMTWMHDFSAGAARINIYAGIMSAFMIHDASEATLKAAGGALAGMDEIPLVFEDKTFVPADIAIQDSKWNTAAWGQYGDLWFPHVYETNQNPDSVDGTNPSGRWDYGPWFWPIFPAPLALPTGEYGHVSETLESIHDTPVINGVAYPNLNVEPKAYRFRLVNAANTRVLNLGLYVAAPISIQLVAGGSNYSPPAQPATATTAAVPGTVAIISPDDTGLTPTATLTVGAGGQITSLVLDPPPAGKSFVYRKNTPTISIIDQSAAASGTGALAVASANTEVPMVDAVQPAVGALWDANTYDGRPGGLPDPASVGPNIIHIGTEAGFLALPNVIPSTPVSYQQLRRIVTVYNVLTHGLYVGPGENADMVIDFSQFAGQSLIVYNDAPAPDPLLDVRDDYYTGDPDHTSQGGADSTLPGYGPNTRTIMRINVAASQFNGAAAAAPYDPTGTGGPLLAALPRAFAAGQDKPLIPQGWQNSAYRVNYNDNLAHIYAGSFQQPTFSWTTGGVAQTLQGFRIDSAGTGYTVPPTVTLVGGIRGNGVAATAHAVLDVTGNRLDSIVLDTPGSGYVSEPTVVLTGGDGLGASATAMMSSSQELNVQGKGIQELFDPRYGRMNATFSMELPFVSSLVATTIPVGSIDPPTEMIADGETQIWKVTHNGVATHMVTFQLFDVQIINRVAWDGTIVALEPAEYGWKQTVKMNPLEDIFLAVRPRAVLTPFGTPQSIHALDVTQPIGSTLGFSQTNPLTGLATSVTNQVFNFDWEYVWTNYLLGNEAIDFRRPVILAYGAVQPAAVTNVRFNPATQTVTWTDPTPAVSAGNTTPGNKANEIGFLVQRTDSGTFAALLDSPPQSAGQAGLNPAGQQAGVVPANATSYVDKVPGTSTTQYRVVAFNSAGYSPSYTATVAGTGAIGTTAAPVSTTGATSTGAPAAPTSVQATLGAYNPATGGFPVTLTWHAVSQPANGFQILRQGGVDAAGAPVADVTTLVPATTLPVNGVYSFIDVTPTELSGYTYTVFADNRTTGKANLSPGTFVKVYTKYGTPPGISGVNALGTSNGNAVLVSWDVPPAITPDPAVTAVNHITGYRIVRTDANGVQTEVAQTRQAQNAVSGTITPAGNSWTDIAPTIGMVSTYTVYGVNANLLGTQVLPASASGTAGSSATITPGNSLAPGLSGLTGSVSSATSVTLTWAAPPAGAKVTGFVVQRTDVAAQSQSTLINSSKVAQTFVDTTASQNTQYQYSVSWTYAGNAGNPASVNLTTAYQPAAAPVSLIASTSSSGAITLSWLAGGPVTNYVVNRCDVTTAGTCTSAYTAVNTGVLTANTLTDTTAVLNQAYQYEVIALNGPNSISAPTFVSVFDAVPPVAPVGVSNVMSTVVSGGTNGITVNWTASTNATGYLVQRSLDGGINYANLVTTAGQLATVGSTATSFTDTGVTLGNTYVYRVLATQTLAGFPDVLSAPSTPTLAYYRLQPAPVVNAPLLGGTVGAPVYTFNLSEAPLTTAPAVSGIVVTRTASTGTVVTTALAATATSYADAPAVGATYTYVFSTLNALGSSAAPAIVADVLVPAAPSAASVAFTSATADTLTFSVPVPDPLAPPVTGYAVSVSTNGAPAAPIATVMPTGASTYTLAASTASAVALGNSYTYTVVAQNLAGSSPAASAVFVDQAPNAPTAPTATWTSATTATLRWTAATVPAGAPAVTGYNVYLNGASTPLNATPIPAATRSYVATVATGASYSFTVQAVNALSASASSTAVPYAQTAPLAPSAVTPTYTKVGTAQAVQLNITEPLSTIGAPAVTSFAVYRSTSAASAGSLIGTVTAGGGTAFTYTDSSGVVGTTYFYTVTASNPVGTSAATTPLQVDLFAPVAPTGLTTTLLARNATTATASLAWTAPAADPNGAAVTGYQVWATVTTAAGVVTTAQQAATITGTTATVTTTVGSTYAFSVRAVYGSGISADSNVTTVAVVTAAAPSGVTYVANSGTSTTVGWTPGVLPANAPPVTAYNVYNGTSTTVLATVAVSTANPAPTSVAVTTVVGTTYNFVVKAVNAAGVSAASTAATLVNTVPARPAAPSLASAALTAGSLTSDTVVLNLTAAAPVTNGLPVTSYLVEYSATATFPAATAANYNAVTVAASTLPLTATVLNVARGTTSPAAATSTAWFRVTAINTAGNSVVSPTLAVAAASLK